MAVQLVRHRFTTEEYHRMGEAGIFSEDHRLELIHGEIVNMAPIDRRHAGCVDRLNDLFTARLRGQVIVRVQNPVQLGPDSEPQPDLALLRPRADFYSQAHPGPEDIFLVVEVVDTSVDYDRAVKVPLYAGSGVPEVWVVDLPAESVEVFREPTPAGYQQVRRIRRGEQVAPVAFPSVEFSADDLIV